MKWKNITLGKIIFISIISVYSDLLFSINEKFIATYEYARNHLISMISPIMICNGDYVIIIHRGQRFEEQVIPELYHRLKSISHIPLKLYLTLMFNSGNLSKRNYIELKQYLKDIRLLRSSIQFPPHIQQTQYTIIDLSIEYIRTILKTKFVDKIQLRNFCQEARKLFRINIELAARVHLNMLDTKIRPWYQSHFNDTERQSLKVLIMGPKVARYGSLEKEYFYALLGESYEGNHIIYVEDIDSVQKALQILGVWLLDAKVSDNFFDGDSERLHRDLLADTASEHIRRLFKKSKNEL